MAEQDPSKILFLIGGNAGHGKDTFAEYLNEVMLLWVLGSVYSTAYAYGIKKILHETYGVPWEVLNGDKDVKESTYVYMGDQKTPLTVRKALQSIGQFHRETFGPTCWAAATLTRCKASNARICIVTDARHPAEEIHWIGEQAAASGFLVIPVRVRRSSVPVNPDHLSESLILKEPDSAFSFLIENESDLPTLRRAAEQLACAAVMLQKAGKTKLPKKLMAFGIRAEPGHMPYEPTLSAESADLLADKMTNETGYHHTVEVLKFDLLKGVASGH